MESNILACNYLSWIRTDLVQITASILKKYGIDVDLLVSQKKAQKIANGSLLVCLSSKPISICEAKDCIVKTEDSQLKIQNQEDKFVMENNSLLIEIEKRTGYITRLFQKRLDHEFIDGMGNRILLFKDEPRSNPAWNIDKRYKEKPLKIPLECDKIEIIEDGPLRVALRIVHSFEKSIFIQNIYLRANSDLVEFSMDVDWHQEKTLFKLAFPTTIDTETVESEIPYAYISRPVRPKTKMDKARWEYACQKWIDLSDDDFGFGLVNNCKYGFSMEGPELRLTVLNGPKYAGYAKETMFVDPDDTSIPEYVDQFKHEGIKYAIFTHKGDWTRGTWRHAIEFNYPLEMNPVSSFSNDGNHNEINDLLLSCSASNVSISALKIHEDESNLQKPTHFIMRVVEKEGKDNTKVNISLPRFLNVKNARIMDLLEMKDLKGDVSFSSNEITTKLNAFEIQTILFEI
jgi:alpha-mannosidase